MSANQAASRIVRTVAAVAIVVVVTFAFVQIVPGNPARAILGPQASQEAVDGLSASLGLNDPVLVQFGSYVSGIFRGDLGESAVNGVPVAELIGQRLAPTMWLMLLAALFTIGLTVPLALVAALREGGLADRLVNVVPVVVLGLPPFWLALMLIEGLAIRLDLFPPGGYGSSPGEHLTSLVLPALVTAVSILPFTVQSLRSALIDVLQSDYVAAARARGVPARSVMTRHVFPNAAGPAIVVLGLNMGWLVGNTIVVEKIFAIPGVGSLLVDSILTRDFSVVQGVALVLALLVVAINVGTEIGRSTLDPRLRTA